MMTTHSKTTGKAGQPLTELERDVLMMTARGMKAKAIGDKLAYNTTYVAWVLGNARLKLEAKTTAEAVYLAAKTRVI